MKPLARIAAYFQFRKALYSFKFRVRVIILLSALIPLVLVGSISYLSISSIINNKIDSSARNNVLQEKMKLESIVDNLNHVSQQLAYDGRVGSELEAMMAARDPYEKFQYETDIRNSLNLISFTNPNVGLTFYYNEKDQLPFFQDNIPIREFDPDELPVLLELYGTTYFGPHRSLNRYVESNVFSVIRRLEILGYDNLYVYVESSPHDMFSDRLGLDIIYAIVDHQGRVAYSDHPLLYPPGAILAATQPSGEPQHRLSADHIYMEKAKQGWTLVSIIPSSSYNKERINWFWQYLVLSIVSLGVALLFSWIIWRTVYSPLSQFRREIKFWEDSSAPAPLRFTRIDEFDSLLQQFQRMKQRIHNLLIEIQQKEEGKAQLEVEKLMYQINPHFIHNTLDTIRWLARLKGEHEIDRLISTLNKLLYYNMGKDGVSTVGKEIDALRNYIALQQVRFEFTARIDVEAELMDVELPRFIIQPLVENSLYHGIKEQGIIELSITREHGRMLLQVSDNGVGIQEAQMQALLHRNGDAQDKTGLGIGLYYVRRMLVSHYGEQAKLDIRSVPGEGTAMQIQIPLVKGDNHAQSIGS